MSEASQIYNRIKHRGRPMALLTKRGLWVIHEPHSRAFQRKIHKGFTWIGTYDGNSHPDYIQEDMEVGHGS